jgi:membrane protease YdiL (CAAX protease family)
LVGVLIQTGAEEVLFRGYLQQQLAARFSSPMIWMVLPSALFAALHYQPEVMGDNTWLMMGAVFVFALLAADLTAVTGTIGAAWAMHFVNNALAILVMATDGPLSGLALYIAPISPASPGFGRCSTSTSRPRSRSGR